MYVVYGLEDPRDGKIWYVGMTNDPFARYCQHIRCIEDNQEKNEWIHTLLALGYLPVMRTLEVTHKLGHAKIREVYWMEHYTYLKMPLTNFVGPVQNRRHLVAAKKEAVSTSKREAVAAMVKDQCNLTQILRDIWHVEGSGRPFVVASAEYREILASLMPNGDIEDETVRTIRDMVRLQTKQNGIVQTVFHVPTSGKEHDKAASRYREIVAELVSM